MQNAKGEVSNVPHVEKWEPSYFTKFSFFFFTFVLWFHAWDSYILVGTYLDIWATFYSHPFTHTRSYKSKRFLESYASYSFPLALHFPALRWLDSYAK